MDLQLVERENTIVGQDFLTWLWFRSESGGALFKLADNRSFSLNMEQRISVQGGEGEGVETATVSSPRGVLSEAKTGLRTGKKVNKAQIRFELDSEEWLVQVKADDFGMTGLKAPKMDTRDEEGDDPDAKFLEKIYLIETCLQMFDVVFTEFLDIRLAPGWNGEAEQVKEWITE